MVCIVLNMKRSFLPSTVLVMSAFFLFYGCASSFYNNPPNFEFNKGPEAIDSNLSHINEINSLDGSATEQKQGDYYFVMIADTQNLVRSNDFARFNLMAKQILFAQHRGKRVYEQIRFIVHNGDNVFNGADQEQWFHLKRAFSMADYKENNTPYIKLLVKEKPIFPVLGNHDVMKLQFRPQTPHRDLAGSPEGLMNFKEFYNWPELMVTAGVLAPIPAELSMALFQQYIDRFSEASLKERFKALYIAREERFYLKVFQELIELIESDPSPDTAHYEALILEQQKAVIDEAMELYEKLGIQVLPVLGSDQMTCYGLVQQGMMYLMLDSMARGWHYKQFSRLKRALNRQKEDQHCLNLFSPSPLNAQYNFFKAFTELAVARQSHVAVFMHHSAINSVNPIDAPGLEYNLRLILGLDRQQNGGTFWDELLFSRLADAGRSSLVRYIFTSCVHYYQHFCLHRQDASGEMEALYWHISGGGGGALEIGYDDNRLKRSIIEYNKALQEGAGSYEISLIENQVQLSYNLLLIHVRNGQIVEVLPIMPARQEIDLKSPRFFHVRARWNTGFLSRPFSMAQLFTVNLFSVGMEWLSDFLQFITLDPSVGIGFIYYNSDGSADQLEEYAGLFELSPLEFRLRFPREKELTLMLPGIIFMNGEGTHARSFLTMGLQLPLFHHLFGVLKPIQIGFKYLLPVKLSSDHDPDFGKTLRWCVFFNYTF